MPASLQAGAGEQAAEAAADDDDVDLVEQRVALDRLDVRVLEVVGELARDLDVLLVAVGPQALVALGAVLLAQGVGIERRRLRLVHGRHRCVPHRCPSRSGVAIGVIFAAERVVSPGRRRHTSPSITRPDKMGRWPP